MSAANSIPPRSDLQWLAVDLDGTLAKPVWTADNPTQDIGDPIAENVAKLRACLATDPVRWKVVVHTARPWTDHERIKEWLIEHGIPFREIVCGKLLAHRYIDDRAISAFAPNWAALLAETLPCDCKQKEAS
jgi:hypothetical protein